LVAFEERLRNGIRQKLILAPEMLVKASDSQP
jgi:hypothetical protein